MTADRWTEDMTVELPAGVSLEHVVSAILERERDGMPYESIISELALLGISEQAAQLAHDRVLAGLVRAATGSRANEPSRSLDAFAWAGYQRCVQDPTLIRQIRPELASRSGSRSRSTWWKFWRRY